MNPYYEQDGCVIYCADFRDITPNFERVNVTISDPPYSEHTHSKQWIGHALTDEAKPRTGTKFKELGFDPLTDEVLLAFIYETKRLTERWTLAFCDLESIALWRSAILASGLEYVRACVWDKVDSAPQFTGDRPAAGAEALVVAHTFFEDDQEAEGIICAHPAGRKHWNGGGRRNVFRHAVNGPKRGPKPHPSTKPLPLMAELVQLFSDPGETILDFFMGSGQTLKAAKLLGRKAIGIEKDEAMCEKAALELQQTAMQLVPDSTEVETGRLF